MDFFQNGVNIGGTISDDDLIAAMDHSTGRRGYVTRAALLSGVTAGNIPDGDKGDIITSGSGTVWSVDAGAITNAKMANVATATIKGRVTAGTGVPEDLTATQARTLLNVANGATANATDAQLRDRSTHTGTQLAATISDFSEAVDDRVAALLVAGTNVTLSYNDATNQLTVSATGGGGGVSDGDKGDVTVSAAGATWTIDNDAVTNAKAANMATATIKGRATAGTGDPEDLSAVQVKTLLAVGIADVTGLQTALDTKLSEDLATDITTPKTSFSNTDRGILLDAAAADVPKTFTGAVMRQRPVVALGTTGTVNLDLDVLSGALGTIVATGNITLTTSNRAAGKHGELRIDANGATRTITYPAWNAFGAALVTSITSGQVLRIAFECTGTTDGSIDATSALKV